MYAAYTAPVFGTTSMIGSNWPDPLHAQRAFAALHVAPPLLLMLSAIHGVGQLPGQGLPAYRVARVYTQGALGSAAIAGSQSSAMASIGNSPAQPTAAAAAIGRCWPTLPSCSASSKASARSSAISACSAASGFTSFAPLGPPLACAPGPSAGEGC